MMTSLAYIGLGSNLGDRLQLLRSAVDRLGAVTARSAIFETAPVGPPQPDYLNAVVALQTDLPPEQLLARLLEIEAALGRVRRDRWGPRLIDLDLLAVDGLTLATPTITLPHPEIAHRAFVLRPWLDIAPDLALPGLGPLRALWDALPEADRQAVRPFVAGWGNPA